MCVEVGEGGGIRVEVSVCSQTYNIHGAGDSLFMKPSSEELSDQEGKREPCA